MYILCIQSDASSVSYVYSKLTTFVARTDDELHHQCKTAEGVILDRRYALMRSSILIRVSDHYVHTQVYVDIAMTSSTMLSMT